MTDINKGMSFMSYLKSKKNAFMFDLTIYIAEIGMYLFDLYLWSVKVRFERQMED
jgi:hypothetical protein